MMLPGALGSAELGFQLIDWWAPRMKIVTPYYIAGRSIAETQTVLERILDAEGIDKTSVLGSSFAGTLAQSWTRAHPERTERMVLSTPSRPIHATSGAWRCIRAPGFTRSRAPGTLARSSTRTDMPRSLPSF